MRTEADLRAAAERNGMRVAALEWVPMPGRGRVLVGRLVFNDPWAAARFLDDEATEDASDPYVRGYSLAILKATAKANGLSMAGPARSPELLELFARAIHANVQRQIEFVNEPTETFQSARETLEIGAGDCDDHARLVKALCLAGNLPARLVFFEADAQPVHVVNAVRPGNRGPWRWQETTLGARYGEHPYRALERLELQTGENPLIYDRPAVGWLGALRALGDTRDEVVATQTRVEDLQLATALAIEQCKGKIDSTAWGDFSKRVLAYVSADPSDVTVAAGAALAAELYTWSDKLRAAGCNGPIAAPLPHDAPPPPPSEPGANPLLSTIKVVAIAGAVVAGAWAASKFAGMRKVA